MAGKKIYVCKQCAEELGASTETPYMWHICERCGDGKCDLYEVDEPEKEEPVQEEQVPDAE
mgnify:CR=1 FL=1